MELNYEPSGNWYAQLRGYPQVCTSGPTWGGLRFKLAKALSDYVLALGVIEAKGRLREAKARLDAEGQQA